MQIFIYDNTTNSIKIDEYSILLVKEFAELWKPERNKCKEDPKGLMRLRAFREISYIYLMLDYKSPYFQYLEQDKNEASLADSRLTEKETKDEDFINAYNKYQEILDADAILSLIKTAHRTLYKTQVFLDNIDLQDVDEMGKPIYKPDQVIKDIGAIGKMRTYLQELEVEYKKGLAAKSKIRGDNTPGFLDGMGM